MIAGAALLIATPQLGTLLLISLERLLVGALLVVEEVLATALLMGTRAVIAGSWEGVGVKLQEAPLLSFKEN